MHPLDQMSLFESYGLRLDIYGHEKNDQSSAVWQ